MKADTFEFESNFDTKLHVHHWGPDDEPRAVVQIAHGLAEHGARYEPVGVHLAEAGYAVYANDHRGHGHSAGGDENLGWFGDEDGWNRAVGDLRLLNKELHDRHPDLPVVLLGHSMGSFMTQQYLFQHPESIVGAVLSGSNATGSALEKVGRWIVRFERLRQGARGRSKLADKLSFGSFNDAFKPNRTDFDWLSRDDAEVDKYVADPWCGFIACNQLWIDFLGGLGEIARAANIARIPKDMPIYIFSGSLDPVCAAGKGFHALVGRYRDAGLDRVTSKLYEDGRHEMFNETNRDEVLADLLEWLDEVVSQH